MSPAKSTRGKTRAARTSGPAWAQGLTAWLPGMHMTLLLGTLALAALAQAQLFNRHLLPGLLLWAAAGACGLWAFRGQPDRAETPAPAPRTEMWLLLGVAAVAAAFRFWQLAEIPHGYFFDEAVNALEGLRTLKEPGYLPIFGPSDAPLPALHFYLNALALALGGVSALATKFVPVIVGTLTVVMFYFLARRVVSMPVALAAALLLAVMRWHVNFSRINFVGISTPLFGAAAAYFLLRGLETKNRWAMALSGLAVAMGLYTYYASNLVPLVIAPYLALQLAWEKDFLKKHWQGLAIFLGVAFIAFAPLGVFALTQPDRFFARNNQVLIFNHVPPAEAASAFWNNVKTTLLMFNYFGDCNGRHNLPEAPMLDAGTGLLFGLGLIWSLVHARRRHAFLAAWWFLVALIPGFLTIEAPQGYRCIGAIVPVALLAGIGLERVWQGAAAAFANTSLRPWLWLALPALGVWAGWQNADDYFNRQANQVACWSEFSCREAAMGDRIQALGPRYHAYISALSFNYPTIRFLGYPYLDSEPFQIGPSVPSGYAQDKNLVYMLLPVHDGALAVLQYYYPQGQAEVHPSPYDFTLFTEFRVPRAQIEAGRGLAGRYTRTDGTGFSRLDGGDAFQLPADRLAGAAQAVWTGSLRAPAWERYYLRVNGAAWSRVTLDGEEVSPAGVQLSQGMHALELRAGFVPGRTVSLFWKRGSSLWSAVPGTELSPNPVVHGLTGTYYPTGDFQGQVMFRRVDPLLALLGADFTLAAPFSVRWEGTLTAPKNGLYTFGVYANETAEVYLDGRQAVSNDKPDTYVEAPLRLAQGTHRLRIDFRKPSGAYPQFVLYWTPPGQTKQKVPYPALAPR